MNITIKAKNIELTEKIKTYAEEKIGSLDKFFDNIITARIDVGKESDHHNSGKIYYTHVNLNVPGKTLRVEEQEKTLLKAIDKAKDDLQRELKRYKAKYESKQKSTARKYGAGNIQQSNDEIIPDKYLDVE